jgi:hypothetical protein
MDVILHIGAHRCATTTFQDYMRKNADRLGPQGIGFWGPRLTRDGLFRGLTPGPQINFGRDLHARALGRVRLRCLRAKAGGLSRLIVSDENMLGTIRQNLRIADLYGGAGERIARYGEAFEGRIGAVALNIRGLDRYWGSAVAYSLSRGRGMPRPGLLDRIAASRRSWRDVITDIACALPDVPILVLPFETYAGRPEAQLAALTGRPAPVEHARGWLNAAPRLPELRRLPGIDPADLPEGDGRWYPLHPDQAAALRERYADDMMWLGMGADGLATLVQPTRPAEAADNALGSEHARGRRHDRGHIHLAHAR